MVTTIQLDNDTKKQLTEIAKKLGVELKKNLTYNQVIKYFLQFFPVKYDKSQLNSLRGIISINEANKSLKELKCFRFKKGASFLK